MVTPEQLREMFDYNPETGLLFWKKRNSKRIHIGDIAGCKSSEGRVLIGVKGRIYKAHRIAWAIMTGEWPTDQIDHINQNPSDNRWENLREVCKSQNMMNISRINSNTSGIKGVGWSKASQKWRAYIRADGTNYHLGVFDKIEDAAKARRKAEEKFFGEFAPH